MRGITIQIDRLLEFYDPFSALGLPSKPDRAALGRFREKATFVPDKKRAKAGLRWHMGRVRYLARRLDEGWTPEPIDIDNYCDRGHIYGPIVLDGHHRLVASIVVGKPTIKASYSGRVDIRDYLTGRRVTPPVI